MCFHAIDNEPVREAADDIIVFKVLGEANTPYFIIDRIAEASTVDFVRQYQPYKRYDDKLAKLDGDTVNRAFHSYPKKLLSGGRTMRFMIPKGTKYRLGRDYFGNLVYVSDSIVAGSLLAEGR